MPTRPLDKFKLPSRHATEAPAREPRRSYDDATYHATRMTEAHRGPSDPIHGSGARRKYAKQFGPTYHGAVTHPGGGAEKHDYTDL